MISAPLGQSQFRIKPGVRGEGSDLLEGRQRQPQKEDKLEGKVEGEPVDDADKALNNTNKGR